MALPPLVPKLEFANLFLYSHRGGEYQGRGSEQGTFWGRLPTGPSQPVLERMGLLSCFQKALDEPTQKSPHTSQG